MAVILILCPLGATSIAAPHSPGTGVEERTASASPAAGTAALPQTPDEIPHPQSAVSGTEPAPMGIADLGGGSSGGQPATFNTTTFRGTVDVGAVSTYNSSLGSLASWMSFQLNAFLVFYVHGTGYSYWTQDVVLLNTENREVTVVDNVWNVTSVDLTSSALRGNGSVLGVGDEAYYGYAAPCHLAGACTALGDPSTITLELRASLGPGGVPRVRFQYADGGSLVTYDVVTFPYATSVAGFPGFYVDSGLGLSSQCPRCYGDVEMVAGGPGNGSQTALSGSTDLVFSLDWWNGGNFEPVPNAADYGRATEEGISSAAVVRTTDAAGEPEAVMSYGSASPLSSLWTQSELSTVDVSVETGSKGGNLSLGGALVPFTSTSVETLVVPTPTAISVTSGGVPYPLGTPRLWAGEVLTLEVGELPLVFVPSGLPNATVWSVTVGGTTLYGTQEITFAEADGTYPYSVGSVSGYRSTPTSGSATVAGTRTNVTVDWSPTPSGILSELWKGISTWAPLLVVVAVLVAVAAGIALARRRPGAR